MVLHEPFGHLWHKLWWKERSRVKPPKGRNRPDPSVFRCSAIHRWKALNEGYNFSLGLITIGSLHRKLCALNIARILVVGISRLPLENPGTKSHLDVAPVESCRVYYMGEGGGFPWVRAVVSLVNPELPVTCPSTKGALENDLTNCMVGFMQVRVSN
jgi:hypothetical protein